MHTPTAHKPFVTLVVCWWRYSGRSASPRLAGVTAARNFVCEMSFGKTGARNSPSLMFISCAATSRQAAACARCSGRVPDWSSAAANRDHVAAHKWCSWCALLTHHDAEQRTHLPAMLVRCPPHAPRSYRSFTPPSRRHAALAVPADPYGGDWYTHLGWIRIHLRLRLTVGLLKVKSNAAESASSTCHLRRLHPSAGCGAGG